MSGTGLGGASLQTRVLATAIGLALVIYLVALLALAPALRASKQQALDLAAARELDMLVSALRQPAENGDTVGVKQAVDAYAQRARIVHASFASAQLVYEAGTPDAGAPPYPAWFAALVGLRAPQVATELLAGSARGTVKLALDTSQEVQDLWAFVGRFTLLAAALLAGVMALLRWMLAVNLRGLGALRVAASRIEEGDFSARASVALGAPPEIRATTLAFNRMADRIGRLVGALEVEQRQLAMEKERLRVTIESIGDAVVVTDARGVIEFLNPKAEAMTGISSREAHGRSVAEILPLADEAGGAIVVGPLERALQDNAVVELESHTLQRSDGAQVAISDTASPIRGRDGTLLGGVLVFQDESERRSLMNRLAWQAERDYLTALWNRRAMEARLGEALQAVRKSGRSFIFCYIDLDRFKLVNDTCGHRAGDALLQQLGMLMTQQIADEHHYLARIGGDEFGLLFVDTPLAPALDHVEALRDEIGRFRFEWEDNVFRIGASFGMTELHAGMNDISDILAQADTACFHAKTTGGNAIQIYEKTHPALQKINDEMKWVSAVTKAFEAHRFVLYRQRKVALSKAQTEHYEILLRLREEDGTVIAPSEFLPAAEHYGLAPSFDRWVIRNLFAYLDTHPEDGASYALNLSGRSLSDPGTAEFILDEIRQYHFDPKRISFEVTETAAVDSLDVCERLILALKARGIEFALDDFGKGQSSFGYLKRLPVSTLKIDGDFVRGMNTDREKHAIVKAMHTLAHELGKQTIAEQVETEAELTCLKDMGVDFVQGYWLDRPSPLPV